jgi:hypothetical protein
MKKQMKTLVAALLLVPVFAVAQTLTGVKVEPAAAKVGDAVKIVVTADVQDDKANCGLRVHFGDGATQDFKITDAKMLPLTVEHKYAKAGDFKVMAEPKTVTSHARCVGKNQNTMVKVAAPPPPPVPVAAAAAPAAKAGPQCPDGWKLNAKSVNKKTGAFECNAKPGTKLPEAKLACPGSLSYMENAKKGMIACRAG